VVFYQLDFLHIIQTAPPKNMEGNRMKCSSCQFENTEEAKFCKKCGDKIELSCPYCEPILKLISIFENLKEL